MISKFKLPQATICVAVEQWLRSLPNRPDLAASTVISVRLKSLITGEYEAYVETPTRPKSAIPTVGARGPLKQPDASR